MTIYLDMMNAAIGREKEMIGGAAITIAKRVKELEVNNDGAVIGCKVPNEDEVFCRLINEYERITGDVALTIFSKAIEPLITPKLKPPYKIEVRIRKT